MYRYYLEYYYDKDDRLTCLLHEDNKVRRITNKDNLKKIEELREKYHAPLNKDYTVTRRVQRIIADYNKYQQKKQRKLIIYNLPKVPVVLAKAYPKATAFILSISLATAGVAMATTDKEAEAISPPAITYEIEDEDYAYEEDLSAMMEENADTFHFSYQDRSNSENMENARRYEDLFNLYGARYGIDPNLLMALASQESGGEHYNNLDNGPAEGIMQIEKSVHIGTTVSAYNVETGENESIEVTAENLQDLETNIRVGTMILQNCLKEKNYNIPLALQTYNFGPGNISELENIDVDSMINDPTNSEWMRYRSFLGIGDPEYVEHVFSYLNPEEKLTITTSNQIITLNIANDYEKTKEV